MKEKILKYLGVNPYDKNEFWFFDAIYKIFRYGVSRVSIVFYIVFIKLGLCRKKKLNFMIVGAQKAGTTWIHSVYSDANGLNVGDNKESHFFDRGVGFTVAKYFDRFRDGVVNGEVAPDYSVLNIIDIWLIKLCFTDVNIAFIARSPFQRAISEARMELTNCGAGDREISSNQIEEYCLSRRVRRRSDYQRIVRRWRKVFGARFKVFYYEDMCVDQVEFLHDISGYLLPNDFALKNITESEFVDKVVFSLSDGKLKCSDKISRFYSKDARCFLEREGRQDLYDKWGCE